MQNDYLKMEYMLSLVSQKWSIVKYVVLKKILFFFLCFDLDLTWTLSWLGLDNPGPELDKGGLDYSPTLLPSELP